MAYISTLCPVQIVQQCRSIPEGRASQVSFYVFALTSCIPDILLDQFVVSICLQLISNEDICVSRYTARSVVLTDRFSVPSIIGAS